MPVSSKRARHLKRQQWPFLIRIQDSSTHVTSSGNPVVGVTAQLEMVQNLVAMGWNG